MDDKPIEERELVAGTNIPRPRYRAPYESDEDYVTYLKGYYSKYFPEMNKEEAEVQNANEVEESNVPRPMYEHELQEDYETYLQGFYGKKFVEKNENEVEPTNVENTEINKVDAPTEEEEYNFTFDLQNNKEEVESKASVSDEEEFSYIPFDTSAISQTETKEEEQMTDIQANLEHFADDIVQNEEMVTFDTNAVPTTNDDAVEVESITESNNNLRAKAKSPNLWKKAFNYFTNIKNSLIEKANNYFADVSSIYNEENVAVEGRIR